MLARRVLHIIPPVLLTVVNLILIDTRYVYANHTVVGEKAGRVRYVDADSVATKPDGLSWATAFPTIQEGVSASYPMRGGEVWVAEGVYNAPVVMREGDHLYGGFAGTESYRSQRDWRAHPTIVDGHNQYTCFTTEAIYFYGVNEEILDGFTIRNGRPGMYNDAARVTVANCTFSGNAGECGAAIYNEIGNSLVATACTFSDNTASTEYALVPGSYSGPYSGSGGAIYNSVYNFLTLTDCMFVRNTAELMGGAIATYDTSAGSMTNCVFLENSAPQGGALAGIGCFSPDLVNCTLADNTADEAGAIYVEESCFPSLTNCIVTDNAPNELSNNLSSVYDVVYSCVRGGYVGEGNIDGEPGFVDAANGDFRLQAGSPCIDTGIQWDAPDTDILGVSRPQDAGFDMGAYEYESAAEGEGEGEGETGCYATTISPGAGSRGNGFPLAVAVGILLALSVGRSVAFRKRAA